MKKEILLILVALFMLACEKDAKVPTLQFTSTEEVEVSYDDAQIRAKWNCNVITKKMSFLYSTNPNLANANVVELGDGSSGETNFTLTSLVPGVEYYYRYYLEGVNNAANVGPLKSFRTKGIVLPQVSIEEAYDVMYTSATIIARLGAWGSPNRPNFGICYGTNPMPEVDKNITQYCETQFGVFFMENLETNKTYFVRAFARNEKGVAYSNEVHFTTPDFRVPLVATVALSNITQTTAISGGNITDDGDLAITERGLCYGTKPLPDINGNKVVSQSVGVGQYQSKIRYLKPSTKFYVRAYAINAKGISYGEQFEFTTETSSGNDNFINDPNIIAIDSVDSFEIYPKEGYWIISSGVDGYSFYKSIIVSSTQVLTQLFTCTDAEKEQYESMH